jgi:hypothetical protein
VRHERVAVGHDGDGFASVFAHDRSSCLDHLVSFGPVMKHGPKYDREVSGVAPHDRLVDVAVEINFSAHCSSFGKNPSVVAHG